MSKRNKNSRDEQGKWDIGGGALEFGDTVEGTLNKEIQEEYCTKVLSYEFLGYRNVFRKNNAKESHWLTLDFKVLINPATVANGETYKFDEVAFFRLDRLPQLKHSQLQTFLHKYRDLL